MQAAIYEIIETALNSYIKLDPEYQHSLARFSGKSIHIQLTEPHLSIYLFPDSQGFQVLEHAEIEPDTSISAKLINLIQLLSSDEQSKTAALFQKKIVIQGDITLGQSFQRYFQHLDIDWEEHLSQFTGDVIAHQTFSLAKKVQAFGQNSLVSFQQTWSEFIIYETRDLLEKREVDEFLNEVDKIREAIDRLDARINRLIKIKNTEHS